MKNINEQYTLTYVWDKLYRGYKKYTDDMSKLPNLYFSDYEDAFNYEKEKN